MKWHQGKHILKNKRENVCYFETKAQTKPVNDKGEDNIHTVQITCQKRAFIAKEHPVGSPDDHLTEVNLKIKFHQE